MSSAIVIDIALAAVAVAKVLDWVGWLPKRKTAADAAGELVIAEHTIGRIRAELDAERSKRVALEATRSLEPILELNGQVVDLINQVLGTQQQTLEKLANFNGALKRNEEGLLAATEGLKLVAGLLVGATDLPTKERP